MSFCSGGSIGSPYYTECPTAFSAPWCGRTSSILQSTKAKPSPIQQTASPSAAIPRIAYSAQTAPLANTCSTCSALGRSQAAQRAHQASACLSWRCERTGDSPRPKRGNPSRQIPCEYSQRQAVPCKWRALWGMADRVPLGDSGTAISHSPCCESATATGPEETGRALRPYSL